MNFRFLHAADLHLDSPLRGLSRYEGAPVQELRDATREALRGLVRLAIEEEVDLVVLSGDLYDGDWRDFNTGLFLMHRLRELGDAGIRVFAIKGNHDAESQITKSLSWPENVTVFSHKRPETVRVEDLQVALHGQSFAHPKTVEALSAIYPQAVPGFFNIGLLHTSADGREGHGHYAPCSVEGLRSKEYDYWALGHVHQRETLCRDPWIVFPGNIQGRHIRETGAKGALLLTVEDGIASEPEFHPLDVVRWHHLRLDLSLCESADEVLLLVDEQIGALREDKGDRLLALRVTGEGACAAHQELQDCPDRWENEIRALAGDRVWVEKVRLNSRSLVDPQELATRDDVFAGLLNSVAHLEANPEALAEAATKLFSTLEGKLPIELKTGFEPLRPTDPELLRALMPEVSNLLASRLSYRDEESS